MSRKETYKTRGASGSKMNGHVGFEWTDTTAGPAQSSAAKSSVGNERKEPMRAKKKNKTKGERDGEESDRLLTLRGDSRQRGASGTDYMGYWLPGQSDTTSKHTYIYTLTEVSAKRLRIECRYVSTLNLKGLSDLRNVPGIANGRTFIVLRERKGNCFILQN